MSSRFPNRLVVLVVVLVVVGTVPVHAGVPRDTDSVSSPGVGAATQLTSVDTQIETETAMPTSAQTAVAGPSDTADGQIDSCTTIDSSGYYTLTSDITNDVDPREEEITCIEITADDVVLDGDGHEMEGSADVLFEYSYYDLFGGTAIRASNATNVTVQNVQLDSWVYGVRLDNVSDGLMQEVTAYNYSTLSATDSSDLIVQDSTFRLAGTDIDADRVTFRRNDLNLDSMEPQYYSDGISISGDDAVVANNTVDLDSNSNAGEGAVYGLSLYGDNHTVRDNDIFGEPPSRANPDGRRGRSAFWIGGSNHLIVDNTILKGNSLSLPTQTKLSGHGHSFVDNDLSGTAIEFDTNRTRVANIQFGSSDGVRLRGSNNILENVSIAPDSGGLRFAGRNNTLSRSQIPELTLSGATHSLTDNDLSDVYIDDGRRLSFTDSSIQNLRISNSDSIWIEDKKVSSGVSISDSSDLALENITTPSTRTTDVRNSTVRDVSSPEVRLRRSSNNNLLNVTAETIDLESSPRNSLVNATGETIDLRGSSNNTLRASAAEQIRVSSERPRFSDDNTVVGNTADIIRVTGDARNNTIRHNDAAVSLTGDPPYDVPYDNVVVGNNASGVPIGIELENASRTTIENNTVTDATRGIVLSGATDNRLTNNTVVDSAEWDFRSTDGSVDNPVTNLTAGSTVSFESRDVAIRDADSVPTLPEGTVGIGAFLAVENTSAGSWANVTVQYTDADAASVEEGTLQLWRYDGEWQPISGSRLDTARNRVGANVTGTDFGIVAPLGDETDTQRPYGGTAPTLPTVIDASHFDVGGEGVAYHDTEAARKDDSGFRPGAGVDIESSSLGGTGDGSIGHVNGDEWVEYTVDGSGTYTLSMAVASGWEGEVTAYIDGEKIGTVREDTGGWYNFTTVEVGEFTVEEGGEHVIRVESTGKALNFDRLIIEEPDVETQQPYGGVAPTLPGEIDASHFDEGGEGVAYHDTTDDRLDDSGFRPDAAVDIESPSLGGSGDGSVGYVGGDEWVEYTVNGSPGTYTLSMAVASGWDGELTAYIDGEKIGTVVKDTGGWYNFTEVEVGEFTVNESGEHVIRISSTGKALNFDRLVVEESGVETQQPYGGTAPTLPSEIDASHFDEGGEGVSYHDTTDDRLDDSGFRPDTAVDIESPSLGGTGDGSIGYVAGDEWVEYTVNGSGTYVLSLSVASGWNGELTAYVDGEKVGTVVKDTGGWYNFTTVEVGEFTVEEDGEHVIRISSTGKALNFDRLLIEDPDVETQQPYGGVAPTLPGEIDASHFDEGGEGVAYHDTTEERLDDSGFRRDTAVDIESPSLGGTGDGSIGYVAGDEWVEYTVDGSGTYTLSMVVASGWEGEVTAYIDGEKIGTVTEDTGGWYNFTEVEVGEFTVEEDGEHVIRVESTGKALNFDRLLIEDPDVETQQPYGGTAPTAPGTIDASHFDEGGEGISYHDTTEERLDDSGFRSDTAVDIESPSLGGSGDGSVGYVGGDEWVEYTIDAEPGTYALALSVATGWEGELTVFVDGKTVGTITKNTGGWYEFEEVEAGQFTVEEGGEHVIRIESTGKAMNFDYLAIDDAATQQSYDEPTPTLPGEIDASHFDIGGEGVAYHETDTTRRDDSGFRPDVGVDIESPSLGGSGDGSIGYVEGDEWVEYTVDGSGTYVLSLSVASGWDGGLTVFVDGREIGSITKNTGGWYNFTEVEVGEFTVEEDGEHVIRVESTGKAMNFDYLVLEESS